MMWILFGHKGVFMSIPCYCLCRSPNHANTLSKPRDFCLRSTMCSHLSHKHLLILFFSLNRVACMLNAPHAFTACKKKFATHTYAWCTVIKITFCMIDWILTRQWQHDLWNVFHPWWCKSWFLVSCQSVWRQRMLLFTPRDHHGMFQTIAAVNSITCMYQLGVLEM